MQCITFLTKSHLRKDQNSQSHNVFLPEYAHSTLYNYFECSKTFYRIPNSWSDLFDSLVLTLRASAGGVIQRVVIVQIKCLTPDNPEELVGNKWPAYQKGIKPCPTQPRILFSALISSNNWKIIQHSYVSKNKNDYSFDYIVHRHIFLKFEYILWYLSRFKQVSIKISSNRPTNVVVIITF